MYVHSQGSLTIVNCLYDIQHCIHKGENEMCLNLNIFLQGYTKLFLYFWWSENSPQHTDSHKYCMQEVFWIYTDNLSKWGWNLARIILLMYWSWPYLWLPFSKKLLWYRHCFCCVLKLSIGVNRRIKPWPVVSWVCLGNISFMWIVMEEWKKVKRFMLSLKKLKMVLLFREGPAEQKGIPYHTDSRSIKASVCITITVARRTFSWAGTVESFLAPLQWKKSKK